MQQETVIEIITLALTTVLQTALPPLLVGLSLGVLVSIFQAVTSIQEPTLAFVPKIIGVLVAIIVFGGFMGNNITSLFQALYTNMPEYITPR